MRVNPDMMLQIGFRDLPPEGQEKWAQEMTYTSAALFASPAVYEPWANNIPCSYIFTVNDGALPLSVQKGLAEQLGPEAKTASLNSDHAPHVSMPEELVKAIEAVI